MQGEKLKKEREKHMFVEERGELRGGRYEKRHNTHIEKKREREEKDGEMRKSVRGEISE
jgi:hypothetical protein